MGLLTFDSIQYLFIYKHYTLYKHQCDAHLFEFPTNDPPPPYNLIVTINYRGILISEFLVPAGGSNPGWPYTNPTRHF